MQLNIWS